MSRIGKKPVELNGATVSVNGRTVTVESGSAKLSYTHEPQVSVQVDTDSNQVYVQRHGDTRRAKAMHGLTRSLIYNMIQGVTQGFTRELEITGVGWNASVQGQTLSLNIGYADTRKVSIPNGVTVEASKDGKIKVAKVDVDDVKIDLALVKAPDEVRAERGETEEAPATQG